MGSELYELMTLQIRSVSVYFYAFYNYYLCLIFIEIMVLNGCIYLVLATFLSETSHWMSSLHSKKCRSECRDMQSYVSRLFLLVASELQANIHRRQCTLDITRISFQAH